MIFETTEELDYRVFDIHHRGVRIPDAPYIVLRITEVKLSLIHLCTTAYAWTHMKEKTQEATLQSFGEAGFNKVRMCVHA